MGLFVSAKTAAAAEACRYGHIPVGVMGTFWRGKGGGRRGRSKQFVTSVPQKDFLFLGTAKEGEGGRLLRLSSQ